MSDTSDSENWNPTVIRKTKKKVARVLDDSDDSNDSVEEALAAGTSEEEEEEDNNQDESTHVIIESSGDEAEADNDSFKTAGDGVSVFGSSFRSLGRSSDGSEHSNRSRATLDGTSDEQAEISNSSGESLLDISNEMTKPASHSQEKVRKSSDKRKDQPPTTVVPLKPTTSSTIRKKETPSTFVDVEDTLVADLNNITLKGASQFSFKKKPNEKGSKDQRAVGATCQGFFQDEEEEDEEEISANFDFDNLQDSGNGDSDIQVLHEDNHKKQKEKAGNVIDLTSSDTDDLSVLAGQLSLGTKAPKKDPPRRAIFLDEAPPLEKKTYAYDPTNVKHQEFYGDVQRTIAQIAHTIETMPAPEDSEDDLVLPKGLVALFDHQLYGLRWLSWREREFPGGGILADEMGLGKTIMVIALIMKSKMDGMNASGSNEENWIDTEEIGRCIPSKTTLVVCPVGCILQWNDEITSKGKGLRVNLFHGPKRTTSAAQLAQYDVVLTTYHTIIAEIPKDDTRGRSPLLRIYWKRIVLDEAHNIRNPKTAGAIAICKLSARNRWAVTGTPVHNRPEDFYSMAKFLRMKPFDDSKTWDFWIGLKQVRRATDAQQRLHLLGKALILRRTKDEVQAAGGNVKKIPPKTIEIVEVELSEAERRVNDYLVQYSKNMFKQFLEDKDQRTRELNGAAMTYTAERRKNKPQTQAPPDDIKFSHLFALLIRMRQCAVLPHLIETMLEEEEIDEDISFDEFKDEHIISKINPVFDRLYLSSKFKRILEDIETLRAEAKAEKRPMDKVVIVSSWTTTLDILNQHLCSRRFSCLFITGREKTADRTDNMKKFNKYPEKYHICLLSLMAGGVGLNLTGGNHVFFVEPHWNPQLELQAQDRVHRFGQNKNVTIKRYIAKETVEDRIRDLQNIKIDLADGVLNSTKMPKGGGLSIAHLRTLFQ